MNWSLGDRKAGIALAVFATCTAALAAMVSRRSRRAEDADAKAMRARSGDKTYFGLDIGGTLTKIAFYSHEESVHGVERAAGRERVILEFLGQADRIGESGRHDRHLAVASPALGGSLHFIHFETRHVANALSLIHSAGLASAIDRVGGTGGGADLYCDLLRDSLGLSLARVDEMQALVRGVAFLLTHVDDEAFYLEPGYAVREGAERLLFDLALPYRRCLQPPLARDELFPFILVNIGSGVSVLRVDSPECFQRVTGTALGGATFLGLARALTGVASFDEALQLACNGDVAGVNMTVADIYGGDYVGEGFVLPGALTASCFGKLVRDGRKLGDYRREDIVLALLLMITQNLAHIAFQVSQAQGVSRIFFAGAFLRGAHDAAAGSSASAASPIVMRALTFYLDTWSRGRMLALFLRHEGYCGATGALLHTLASGADAL